MENLKEYLCQITFTVKTLDTINAEIEANSAANWMKYDRPDIEIKSVGLCNDEKAQD